MSETAAECLVRRFTEVRDKYGGGPEWEALVRKATEALHDYRAAIRNSHELASAVLMDYESRTGLTTPWTRSLALRALDTPVPGAP